MEFINKRVGEDDPFEMEGTVFLLTDTMASRKEIYKYCITPAVTCLIETRMASTHGNVFTVEPTQFASWFDTLGEDGDLELSPCGTPISVGMTASVIANIAVWQFIAHHTDPLGKVAQADIYLKPFIVVTGDLKHVEETAQEAKSETAGETHE
jgi:hypothetical protein